MAPEAEPLAVEWREDAKPVALCMLCDAELSPEETRCPRCQSAVSLMHRCPRCARVVSAKHLRCPYCSEGFLKNDPQGSSRPQEAGVSSARRQLGDARELQQRRKVLWFSIAVFLTVFVLALSFQRYRPTEAVTVLGSSFVLHDVALRRSTSEQDPALGKLTPPAVVEITGVERDEQGQDWFQIQWGGGTAYVPVTSLAPPKGKDAESGHRLLRTSLTVLDDPGELGDASEAVRLYRSLYPGDTRGEELLWILAGKTREFGLRKGDARLLARARKTYAEVARERGQHAAAASEALAGLSESAGARPSGDGPPAGPGFGGTTQWRAYDPKQGANKIMLLNETEVSVVFSAKQTLQEGDLLRGQVAQAVRSNGETVIPAGSACSVKVGGAGAGKGYVALSLVEIRIGQQSHAVETVPVQVRTGQLLARTHLRFRLRRSLLLAQ